MYEICMILQLCDACSFSVKCFEWKVPPMGIDPVMIGYVSSIAAEASLIIRKRS